MSTFNITIPRTQFVDVAWPGTPVPNSGVIFVSINASVANVATFQDQTPQGMRWRGANAGSTVVTLITQNAVGTQFTDTINVTVTNPVPEATDSGLTISAPHS